MAQRTALALLRRGGAPGKNRRFVARSRYRWRRDWRKKAEDWHVEAALCMRSLLTDFPEGRRVRQGQGKHVHRSRADAKGGLVMIGQTFTRTGRPKLVFRIVWRGSIKGVDCVCGVKLNGKFQTVTRLSEVVLVQAA
jgi:hypothetical protein